MSQTMSGKVKNRLEKLKEQAASQKIPQIPDANKILEQAAAALKNSQNNSQIPQNTSGLPPVQQGHAVQTNDPNVIKGMVPPPPEIQAMIDQGISPIYPGQPVLPPTANLSGTQLIQSQPMQNFSTAPPLIDHTGRRPSGENQSNYAQNDLVAWKEIILVRVKHSLHNNLL